MQAVNCMMVWVSLYFSPPGHKKYLLNCTAVAKHVGNKVTKVELAVGESWRTGWVRLRWGKARVSQVVTELTQTLGWAFSYNLA